MYYSIVVIFATICLISCETAFHENVEKTNCGYQSCHPLKKDLVNVHIVPHTHDDVGWLKTVDQYYYGSQSNIQKAGVQYILDSIVDALKKDKNRRFIYVETAFLWKWWIKQHDFVKAQVRKLINNGQLEMIGGAWSMNDEATTHYQSIIDQFTWGLRKLNETFGECGRPKIGWQIDPFGHSREMASIFAQLGFDGILLGRIDYQDKKFRFETKTAEMIWQGSDNLGKSTDIFTSVMYNMYAPPPGFCFDVLCSDEPIIDNKKSPEYNVDKRLAEFFSYVDRQVTAYKTNNLIVTMGGDFTYQDANMWYSNLDKLISNANLLQNNGSKYHLLYSTPSCYLKAVQEEAAEKQIKWNVKTDDFFPYASDPNAYWTGYFTSRPTIKRFERFGNNFLQVCKQLYAMADLGPEDWADLNVLREAMGVMQHHDAITGTEKEQVAYDYSRLLSLGFEECGIVANAALSKFTNKSKSVEMKAEPPLTIDYNSCLLVNISQCAFTENEDSFVVTVYNPLSRPVSHYVRLPVVGKAYTVTDPKGANIATQMQPIAASVLKIPGRSSKANAELIFIAENLPPLGFNSFYVSKTSGSNVIRSEAVTDSNKVEGVTIKVDKDTGLLFEVSMNGVTIPLTQQFYYYRGAVGDNIEHKNRSSGAYIFRPNGTDIYNISQKADIKLYRGDLLTELHQVFNNWTSQIIRIYNREQFIEFDWLIGPIPSNDVNGKEVITRYTSNLGSESTFYTDSNGREILKRVRHFRPTWKLDLQEPIAGNYYPVTSKILIRDPARDIEMAVLTDRAQGGSSLKDGEIEINIDRLCVHDDAFGVEEALVEQAYGQGLVARGSHFLIVGPYLNTTSGKSIAAAERDLAQRKILSAWTFVSSTNKLNYKDYESKFNMEFAGLNSALPDNVQVLTLEPWKGMDFLLRLEHVLEKNEDSTLSQPAKVNLKDLFSTFKIDWIRETTLGGNQWLSDNNRLRFDPGENLEKVVEYYIDSYLPLNDPHTVKHNLGKYYWKNDQTDSNRINQFFEAKSSTVQSENDLEIVLNPMQIRTFVIGIKDKQ